MFRKQRVVIMIHGCFWHQHPDPACRLARMPKSQQEFWRPKLMVNRARDESVRASLEADGWRVFEDWECRLNAQFLETFSTQLRGLLRD